MIATTVATTSAGQTWTRREGEYSASITRCIGDNGLFCGQLVMGLEAFSKFRRSISAFSVEQAFFYFECIRFRETGQAFGIFHTVLVEVIAPGARTRRTRICYDVCVLFYELLDAVDDGMTCCLRTMAI